MRTLFAVAGVSMLVGCSSVGLRPEARTASDEASKDAELTALRLRNDEQEQELRTLRGQLALARAEVQELRAEKGALPMRSQRHTHTDGLPWAKDGELEMEPVLRVDGKVVDERLPVTADVPDLPAAFAEIEPEPSAAAPPDISVEGYRRGLSLIREQKLQQALVELEAFVSEHPTHPYADNALFWCGEIHYLRHEYDRALQYFGRVEKLHPWGNKAPDALYRMGQIHLRRGDTVRARAYFEKVREQFPDTAAARLALREEAS